MYVLTKAVHILYCIITANMTFESKGKGHNNLVLVVLLVKQMYLTRFVVECLYFAN